MKKVRNLNMHINVGDKFVTVKKVWFLNEGDIIRVTGAGKNNVVAFVFGENFENNGFMDYATFEDHFEKISTNIVKAPKTNFVPKVSFERINEIMENSEITTHTVFGKCTVVSCRLPNGFVIVESSSCVDAENYDEELGFDICLDKIVDKVWELEGYRLQENLYREATECPFGCDDCNECPCDGCCENE